MRIGLGRSNRSPMRVGCFESRFPSSGCLSPRLGRRKAIVPMRQRSPRRSGTLRLVFELSKPKLSFVAVIVLVLAVPMAVMFAFRTATDRSRPVWDSLLTSVVLLAGLVVFMVLLGKGVMAAFVKSPAALRLEDARRVRSDVLYVGSAMALGSGTSITLAAPIGVITIRPDAFTYSPTRQVSFPPPLELAWSDIEFVKLTPWVDFFGKLTIRSRDGKVRTWLVRDLCSPAVVALEAVRDQLAT